jgi:hypothetical protein
VKAAFSTRQVIEKCPGIYWGIFKTAVLDVIGAVALEKTSGDSRDHYSGFSGGDFTAVWGRFIQETWKFAEIPFFAECLIEG